MSKVTRRKHVLKEMMEDDFELPTEQQQIVRVVSSRGNNLHEVEPSSGGVFLASMPNKFRKNMWVKRGDFVIIEPIEEGDKVKGEICKILTAQHVKEYTKAGIWPKEFTKNHLHESSEEENSSDEDHGFVVKNMNRPSTQYVEDEDDSDSDASSD